MSIQIKVKVFIRKRFFKQLDKTELVKYRNVLKLLYHKSAEIPLVDTNKKGKFIINILSLDLHLIMEKSKSELINSISIYPLDLCDEVYERSIKRILEEKTRRQIKMELDFKSKKQTILSKAFNKIK